MCTSKFIYSNHKNDYTTTKIHIIFRIKSVTQFHLKLIQKGGKIVLRLYEEKKNVNISIIQFSTYTPPWKG